MERKRRSQTDITGSTNSSPNSSSSPPPPAATAGDLVQTAGGNIHYVKKQVAYGLHGVIEEEIPSPPKPNVEPDLVKNGELRRSLRRKSSKGSRTKSEGNLALQSGTGDQLALNHTLPAHGDLRHVYLDMTWARFGFRLQSYGRRSEEVKTVVQTVTAGSPAFMAGLHPGDVILEVNGADVSTSSATDIVTAIMETKEKRVQLLVKYVNGAHCLELKKKLQLAQEKLKEKQKCLRELLSTNNCSTSFVPLKFNGEQLPFQLLIDATLNSDVRISPLLLPSNHDNAKLSSDHKPTITNNLLTNGYNSGDENSRIFSKIGVYTNEIQNISCDAIVLPFDSLGQMQCYKNMEEEEERLVPRFLQMGGDKLINELSLANQCRLGEVMMTTGGDLKSIKYLFHCVIGHFETQIKSSCITALEKCTTKKALTVAFWLDGFISCNVPPTMFLETILRTLKEQVSTSLQNFKAIIFASQSMPNLAELLRDILKDL